MIYDMMLWGIIVSSAYRMCLGPRFPGCGSEVRQVHRLPGARHSSTNTNTDTDTDSDTILDFCKTMPDYARLCYIAPCG